MTLAKSYNRILQRAYPDCRMVWSDVRECWRLERRAHYARMDINPANYPASAIDTFRMRRDGFYLCGEYPPYRLPQVDRLVAYLRANDPTRMDLGGGDEVERAVRFCERLEEREAAERKAASRALSFEESGQGSELYDQLAWAEGRRVAIPANATGVE